VKYTFRKLQLKRVPSVVCWYLCIDNTLDLMAFYLNYEISQSIISKAIIEDLNVQLWKQGLSRQKHYASKLSCGASSLAEVEGKSFADTLSELLKNTHKHQFDLIDKGYTVLLSQNGISYSVDKNNEIYNILEEIKKDKPVFPECRDVHYSKFQYDSHWYARIGVIDIQDKFGNTKWNTREEAEKATKWFLNKS